MIVFLQFTWAMRRIWFHFLLLQLFKQSSEKGWSGGHFLAKEGKAKELRACAWGKSAHSGSYMRPAAGMQKTIERQSKSQGKSCQKLDESPDRNFANRPGSPLPIHPYTRNIKS